MTEKTLDQIIRDRARADLTREIDRLFQPILACFDKRVGSGLDYARGILRVPQDHSESPIIYDTTRKEFVVEICNLLSLMKIRVVENFVSERTQNAIETFYARVNEVFSQLEDFKRQDDE